LGWRLAVSGLGPLALLALALLRGAGTRSRRSGSGAALRSGLTVGAAATALALLGLLGSGLDRASVDLTRGRQNQPAPALRERLAAAAGQGPLEIQWIVSEPAALPGDMRAASRRARTLCQALVRDANDVTLERIDPDALEPARASELAALGVERFRAVSEEGAQTSVTDFWSSVVLRAGERAERLDFPDGLAFEDFAFRLGFALWRLAGNEAPQIALATDTPRLSPAEAHQEYQQRRLFAPSGTDVYSLARAALERADFAVAHVDPAEARLPADTDAVCWLQPRRPVEPMLEALALYLHGGGAAFVAGQHFVLQPQQHKGREFETVWWPQPQFLDLEQLYLPDLGVELVREVLFDELRFAAPLLTYVNRDPQARDYERQDAALPFLVRASSARFADDPTVRGIGDQAFPFPARIALDPERLGGLGLIAEVLIETSDQAWSYPWDGGFLPPDAIAAASPELAPAVGAVPLYVRVRGAFPLPAPDLVPRPDDQPPPIPPPPGDGELLLIGGTSLFQNDRLLDPEYRADRLLVNAAASLCLPEDLAQLAGRRGVREGLDFVPETERLAWRARVLASGPLALLLLGLALRAHDAWRRRRRHA
jgi:hypothetical protein